MLSSSSTSFGLSEKGFKTKRLQEIRESLYRRLGQITDPDTGETLDTNFDENDPFVQAIDIFIDELSTCWELMSSVNSQWNPQISSGTNLSGLVQLNGILRREGTKSKVLLKFIGVPGVLIPKGTQVCDASAEMTWETIKDVTIPASEVVGSSQSVEVTAESVEDGAFVYAAGAINQLVDSILGIDSVVNIEESVPGVANETDTSLRLRRNRSTETPAQGIAESLYGALLNLENVSYVKVLTNRTMETDENNIPAKSIAVCILGGEDSEIAETIFNRAGIATGFTGTTEVDFVDSMKQITQVRFTRPTLVPVYVDVLIDKVEGSSFPSNFADQIKENIILFAEKGPSGVGITTNEYFDDFGFPPGENVCVSRLYIPINAVKGVKAISLKIGLSASTLGSEDIEIAWNQVASFTVENITVATND